LGQIAGVGSARAPPHHDAQTRAARSSFFQFLHLAHAHIGRKLLALGDGALGVARTRRPRPLDDVVRQFHQVIGAHAVPPTVILSILMVGIPTPTGTLCPSLPQVPMPSSSRRSLPTILTYFSASGPLPISVALRTGRVSLPSSIKRSEEHTSEL